MIHDASHDRPDDDHPDDDDGAVGATLTALLPPDLRTPPVQAVLEAGRRRRTRHRTVAATAATVALGLAVLAAWQLPDWLGTDVGGRQISVSPTTPTYTYPQLPDPTPTPDVPPAPLRRGCQVAFDVSPAFAAADPPYGTLRYQARLDVPREQRTWKVPATPPCADLNRVLASAAKERYPTWTVERSQGLADADLSWRVVGWLPRTAVTAVGTLRNGETLPLALLAWNCTDPGLSCPDQHGRLFVDTGDPRTKVVRRADWGRTRWGPLVEVRWTDVLGVQHVLNDREAMGHGGAAPADPPINRN